MKFVARTKHVAFHSHQLRFPQNLIPSQHAPIGIQRGEGVWAYDAEGKRYLDCLSGDGTLNHGYAHPHIIAALKEQCKKICFSPPSFHSMYLGPSSQFIASTFGYEKVLLLNTPFEAFESAMKISLRWGYEHKGVPAGRGRVLVVEGSNCEAIIGGGIDAEVSGIILSRLGENGRLLPCGQLRRLAEFCQQREVLLTIDETLTGLGRTGALLAQDLEEVKADMICLGKALSGGFFPISALCAAEKLFNLVPPGWQSTPPAQSPLACTASSTALEVMLKDGLSQNAFKMGEHLRYECEKILCGRGKIEAKGLLQVIELPQRAVELVRNLHERSVLTVALDDSSVLLQPPLVIKPEEVEYFLHAFEGALKSLLN